MRPSRRSGLDARGRRRRRAILAAAALTAPALAGCGAATHHQTLRFDSELSAISDAAPATAVGQQLIFTAQLYPPNGPSAIGRAQASCTRTAPGDGEVYDCLLVFTLARGTLFGLAAASHDGPASGSIAGGTGAYAGVRGTFLYIATGNPRLALTFALTS